MKIPVSILFLFLLHSCYAQLMIPGVVSSSNQQWEIIYEMDFEDAFLGHYNSDSINADFNVVSLNWAGGDTIVIDTIDEVATQVLRISNEAGQVQRGLQMYAYFDSDSTKYEKGCYSYHGKFHEDYEAISGNGKIPALWVHGDAWETGQSCPADTSDGATLGYLYKPGIGFSDYKYSHNLGVSCPWTIDQFGPRYGLNGDSAYIIPGVWYEFTECITMNSFSAGVGNPDGIEEIYINNDMVFQNDTMTWRGNEFHGIDGLSFRQFQSAPSTTIESSFYSDNHTFWVPTKDANFDAEIKHDPSFQMHSPIELSNRDVYFDHLVTSDGTHSTDGFPTVLPAGATEAWLFEGTTGVTVSFTGQTGGGDFIFARDGDTTDDALIDLQSGFSADLSTAFGGDGSVSSTGAKLYIYTVNSEDVGFTKFEMTVDIDPL